MAGQRTRGDVTLRQADAVTVSPVGRKRRPGGGRKRDPEIDSRILGAARDIYIAKGWAGFNFDTVAKAAGTSRDALYRRYSTAEHLLHAVLLNEVSLSLDIPPTDDLRAAIQDFALRSYDFFSVGEGYIALRVHVEAHQFPEVYKAYQKDVLDPAMETLVDSFAAAFAHHSVDVGAVDLRALVESIAGATMMRALLNQATDEDTSRATRARDLVRIQVDQILTVVGLPLPEDSKV